MHGIRIVVFIRPGLSKGFTVRPFSFGTGLRLVSVASYARLGLRR